MRCTCVCFFFFKQKTAYEMRISDWSSDVCSSDLPRRYIDRTKEARIADLHVGELASVLARVERISSRPLGGRGRGRRVMVEAFVSDGSGRMKVTFFNQAWREKQLAPGTEAVFLGKVEDFRGTSQLTNPVVDLVGDQPGQVVPV